jgi:hypothetical protein
MVWNIFYTVNYKQDSNDNAWDSNDIVQDSNDNVWDRNDNV